MQDSFAQKKAAILAEINSTGPDLSPKGSIDSICIPIIDLINSHSDMVTTSSCSGRVSVFLDGTQHTKGDGGRWLFVTHEASDLPNDSWYKDFEFNNVAVPQGTKRYVTYKFEPLILHVKCRDFQSASKLFNVAMSCGFRETGIGSNNIVGIRISIKLDIPMGFQHDDKLYSMVSREYLALCDQMALDRFEENFRKLNELYAKIQREIIEAAPEAVEETKEERRERKRREGLLKQQQKKAAAVAGTDVAA